jgi:UDP-N-acetylmuramyl pentapeptide phosphotransferase/UDP-N-acetylglucosamine-1-phosphate transferase
MWLDFHVLDGPLAALTAAVIAGCVAFAILQVLLRTGWAWSLAVDMPNARSLHNRTVPRVGGWGVVPAAVLVMVYATPTLRWIALGALLLAAVSQIDDRRGVPARVRFACHVAVAGAAVFISSVAINWWQAVAVVIALVWLINLYNFMDGSNGLAGGVAVIGFAAYAIGALPHQWELALAAAAVAGAGLGFLVLNFHPAKLFLGDAGSIPLGFLAGAIGFWGWQHATWPVWFPAQIFSPFILDATVTLLRRIVRGEKFWQAHREHYYQRLVQITGSHVRVACIFYALMFAAAALAFAVQSASAGVQWCGVVFWYVLLGVLGVYVDGRWRRYILVISDR